MKMRSFIIAQLLNFLSWLLKLFPSEKSLRFLLELENYLYFLEGELSVKYGKGLHTKHRHTAYHQFFIKHIKSSDKVLDIGCGNGFVDYQIVKDLPDVKITAIDFDRPNIALAKKQYAHPRLKFIYEDALKKLPTGEFDAVILSNVLEHFKNRVYFLKKIVRIIKPGHLLVRVPLFERDWRVPLKKELGIDWRLDRTHFIEYTQESFKKEVKKANLKIITMEIRWGEIWANLKSQ